MWGGPRTGIGGEARGRRLFAPEGDETRPTSDKVREALFNIIRGDVWGAHVLDLFAGSGALGLEAISRGAESAVFCDVSKKAVAAVKRNKLVDRVVRVVAKGLSTRASSSGGMPLPSSSMEMSNTSAAVS